MPVPPGRANEATIPLPTGSTAIANTIGIVEVTCFVAATALPTVTMTSTLCLTNSAAIRSEEHTSELQSRGHLVCRLLLEKKKKIAGLDTAAAERAQHRKLDD